MRGVKPIRLRLRLTVKTPTAVTTGEEYYDTEYFVKDGKFYVLRKEKLIDRLKASGKLSEFLRLSSVASFESILRMRKLLFDVCREEDAELSFPADREFAEKYERNVDRIEEILSFHRKRALNEINKLRVRKFFRDPVTKKPYIPGSTVKGALRTAILDFIYENSKPKHVKDDKSFNELLECTPAEGYKKLFKSNTSKDLVSSKDLMRFVKVTDFFPVSYEERVGVCYNFNSKKDKKGIPIQVEYLNGGVFEGEVSLLLEYAEEIFEECKFSLTKESLIKALRKHYARVFNVEAKIFGIRPTSIIDKGEIERYKIEKQKLSLVKLGFHAGALSKTISDDRLRRVGNRKTGFRNVPNTIWNLNGKPMGWCVLEVLG